MDDSQFAQRANDARVSASNAADEAIQLQWLMIAEMWELLALETQTVSRMLESAGVE
jgi:hypothetical protein